jgi:hypothetical protein
MPPIDTRVPDTSVASLAFGDYLLTEDDTLRNQLRSQYQKYYALFRDLTISAQFRQFCLSILSNPLRVTAASESEADQLAASLVRSTIGQRRLKLCRPLLLAEPIGWALLKVKWDDVSGYKLPTAFTPMKLDEFRWKEIAINEEIPDDKPIDSSGNYRLVQLDDKGKERDFQGFPKHFLEHTCFAFGEDSGSPMGRGWFEILWWWVNTFKLGGLEAWVQHLQQNGLPPIKVTQQRSNGGDIQPVGVMEAVETALENRAAIDLSAFPGLDANFLNSPGNAQPEKLCEYVDTLIRLFVNGPNLTSKSEQTGTQALGSEHVKISQQIYKASADSLCNTLSRLARWITEENVPGAEPPTLEFVFNNHEEVNREVLLWKDLAEVGYRPTYQKVVETIGEGYELTGIETSHEQRGTTYASPEVSLSQRLVIPGDKPHDIAALDAIDQAAAPRFEKNTSIVRDMLIAVKRNNPEATDRELFEIARSKLWGLFPALDSPQFARDLSVWNTGSNLMGQFDVRGEAKDAGILNQ